MAVAEVRFLFARALTMSHDLPRLAGRKGRTPGFVPEKHVCLRHPSTSLTRARIPLRLAAYRPELVSLEDRLPLGDAFLSAVLGPSLLGPGLAAAELAAWSSDGIPDAGPSAEHRPAQPATASAAPDTGPGRLALDFSM